MKITRRLFSIGLGSFAATPLLPVPVMSATPTAGLASSQLKWAEMIARGQSKSSTGMLVRHLGVSPQTAARLQSSLVEKGVLGSPDLGGHYITTNPIDATARRFGVKFNDVGQRALDFAKRLNPQSDQDQRDDAVPASHANTSQGPCDIITPNHRSGEDLV